MHVLTARTLVAAPNVHAELTQSKNAIKAYECAPWLATWRRALRQHRSAAAESAMDGRRWPAAAARPETITGAGIKNMAQ